MMMMTYMVSKETICCSNFHEEEDSVLENNDHGLWKDAIEQGDWEGTKTSIGCIRS